MPDTDRVIPRFEPEDFVKGDTVKWRISETNYLPSDGWILTYEFASVGDHKQVVGTDNGDETHLITISTTVSKTFKNDYYAYVGYVELSGERYTTREGGLQVNPALGQRISGFDGRSHARKTLDDIEKLIESRMSGQDDLISFSVANRSSTVMEMSDLVTLRSQYQEYVRQEDAQKQLDKGLASGNQVLARFGRI